MFSETPELYDLIYSSFKDYAFESQAIATLLGELAPHCREVLDVACGTGEHARHLQSTHGYHVDGLDIDPGFLELARTKLTGSTLWQGDMADFSLSKSYDAILCLFSSIGYVKTPKRFAEHAQLLPEAPPTRRCGTNRAMVRARCLESRRRVRPDIGVRPPARRPDESFDHA